MIKLTPYSSMGFYSPDDDISLSIEDETIITINHEYLHKILYEVMGFVECIQMDTILAYTTYEGFA